MQSGIGPVSQRRIPTVREVPRQGCLFAQRPVPGDSPVARFSASATRHPCIKGGSLPGATLIPSFPRAGTCLHRDSVQLSGFLLTTSREPGTVLTAGTPERGDVRCSTRIPLNTQRRGRNDGSRGCVSESTSDRDTRKATPKARSLLNLPFQPQLHRCD